MKNYSITSGKFTSAGNFTGYNSIGERLHIHKAQMAALKWTKDEEVKFPFYAVAQVKTIGQLDENGNVKLDEAGVPVTAERLTAMSVYPTREQLIGAQVDNLTLNIDVAKSVKEAASKAGLTEKELSSLVAF